MSKYVRAGIIPYQIIGKHIVFAFGLDGNNNSIVDFGGHIEKIDQDLIETAIREYSEESFNVFGSLTRQRLTGCDILQGHDTIEILYPVNCNIYQISKLFKQLASANYNHETRNIVWLTLNQVKIICDSKYYPMYYRIYNTLMNNINNI